MEKNNWNNKNNTDISNDGDDNNNNDNANANNNDSNLGLYPSRASLWPKQTPMRHTFNTGIVALNWCI